MERLFQLVEHLFGKVLEQPNSRLVSRPLKALGGSGFKEKRVTLGHS